MAKKNVTPVIFTNGLLMTKDAAKRLFDLGASVIVKFDGFEETQDKLTGKGTYKQIHSAMQILVETGFAENRGNNVTRLGAAPCMCTINYDEIPEMWTFLRKNFIFPDFERATTIGNATDDISLNDEQVYKLINKLKDIDRNEFGLEWEAPYMSIPGHNCYIYLSGCHITAYGEVSPCPEIPPVASLRDKPLAQILGEAPFKDIRHIEKHIDEPCSKCEYLSKCFGGCRSKAYYCGKSYFAADPFCTIMLKEVAAACESID